MNKLHVALHLLKLLNERKEIDSALVAEELNVSLRTAQRYLCELSILPCISCDEQHHKYSIDEKYPLKKVLLDCTLPANSRRYFGSTVGGVLQLRETICKSCGGDCVPVGQT